MQRGSSHKIDYFFIMQEQIHFIFLIFRRADILTFLMHRVSIRIQMKKCNPEIVLPWTLLIRRISLPEIMVTVKTSPVTGKPAVKLAKVSRQGTKRNVTVTFTVPKSCDGTDWVLAKKVSKSDNGSYTGVSSYAYTKKNQTKTTVVFKSVKPGVYYLAGRAYVKGYAKSYTKWSKIKKIVVK